MIMNIKQWKIKFNLKSILACNSANMILVICPRYRVELGVFWRLSRKCTHPLHGDRKGKPERGVNLEISKGIMAK